MGIYGWVSSMSLDHQYPNIPKYPALLLKMPNCVQTAIYQWSPIVKLGINLFNCTPTITPSSRSSLPPGFVVSSPSADIYPRRTHSVWPTSQPSVPQVLNSRLEVGHKHSLVPDCNKMPCLTLYLVDVVCFPPNVKTRFKMVQNKQFAVIRYFPYATERIHTPYLYHQESRKLLHSTLTASCYS